MLTRDEAIVQILALMEKSDQLQAESLTKSAEANNAAHEAGRLSDKAGLNWDDIYAVVKLARWSSDPAMRADLSNITPQPNGTFVLHNYDGRPIFQTTIPICGVAEVLADQAPANAA